MNLKNVLLPVALIVSVCLTAILPCNAQSKRQKQIYSLPALVNLDRLVRRNFRDYYRNRQREELVPESFYPIGWSRDGKFAYYTEPVDEACGCYFAKLFILDLKTDSVLWSFDFQGDLTNQNTMRKSRNDRVTLWRKKKKEFSDKLNEHGIEPLTRFPVLSLPAIYKGDQLKTTLTIVENTDEESKPYGIVSKATLRLISKRHGEKTLFDTSYAETKPLDMKVLAYSKSPYEERIAIILIEVHRGWEGPPHTGHVKIAGASLTGGFK